MAATTDAKAAPAVDTKAAPADEAKAASGILTRPLGMISKVKIRPQAPF
jgi:hypothetical protein